MNRKINHHTTAIITPGGSASHYVTREITKSLRSKNSDEIAIFSHDIPIISKHKGTSIFVFADSLLSLISRARRGILQRGWKRVFQYTMYQEEVMEEMREYIICGESKLESREEKNLTARERDFGFLKYFLRKGLSMEYDCFGIDDHFNSALQTATEKMESSDKEEDYNCFFVSLKDPLINKKLSLLLDVPVNIEYKESSRRSIREKFQQYVFGQNINSKQENLIQDVINFYADIDKKHIAQTEEYFRKYYNDIHSSLS